MMGKYVGLRQIVAILAAAAMVMMVGACDIDEETLGEADPAGEADDEPAPDDPDGSDSELPETIRIGATLPLTGGGAAWGAWISQAMDLAAGEINDAGGIHGSTVEIVYEDHRAEASPGATAFRKLAEVDELPVVVSVNSGPVLAQIPIAQETGTVLFDSGTVSPEVREGGEYVFSNVPKADDEAAEHARFLTQDLGLDEAAILYRQDEAGTNFAREVRASIEERGGQVTFEDVHQPDATDFRPALARLDDSGAEVAFLLTYYVEAANLLRQSVDIGVDVTWLTYSTVLNPSFIEQLGDYAAEVDILASTLGWTPDDPTAAASRFIDAYRAAYDEEPEFYSANAYDAVHLIGNAIERCACYDADGIADALISADPFDGVTGETHFDEDGMAVKPIVWYRIEADGSLAPATP